MQSVKVLYSLTSFVLINQVPESSPYIIIVVFPGIDAGKRLGVDPILSAKELSEASEEHLGMMAYAASFTHLKPSKPPSEKVALSGDFNNVIVGNEVRQSPCILAQPVCDFNF